MDVAVVVSLMQTTPQNTDIAQSSGSARDHRQLTTIESSAKVKNKKKMPGRDFRLLMTGSPSAVGGSAGEMLAAKSLRGKSKKAYTTADYKALLEKAKGKKTNASKSLRKMKGLKARARVPPVLHPPTYPSHTSQPVPLIDRGRCFGRFKRS